MGAFFLYLFWVTHTLILQLDRPFSISSGEFLPFNLRFFYGLISGWFAAVQKFIKFEFFMVCFVFIYLFWTGFLRMVDFGLCWFYWSISFSISLIQFGLVPIEPSWVFSILELILSKFSFLCFFPILFINLCENVLTLLLRFCLFI